MRLFLYFPFQLIVENIAQGTVDHYFKLRDFRDKRIFVLVSSTSVLDVPCSHKYMDCGSFGAICDCVAVEANFDCTNSVGATCMCDSAWRMFPVTYDTPQDINGQPSPYTTICELVTGMNF